MIDAAAANVYFFLLLPTTLKREAAQGNQHHRIPPQGSAPLLLQRAQLMRIGGESLPKNFRFPAYLCSQTSLWHHGISIQQTFTQISIVRLNLQTAKYPSELRLKIATPATIISARSRTHPSANYISHRGMTEPIQQICHSGLIHHIAPHFFPSSYTSIAAKPLAIDETVPPTTTHSSSYRFCFIYQFCLPECFETIFF